MRAYNNTEMGASYILSVRYRIETQTTSYVAYYHYVIYITILGVQIFVLEHLKDVIEGAEAD